MFAEQVTRALGWVRAHPRAVDTVPVTLYGMMMLVSGAVSPHTVNYGFLIQSSQLLPLIWRRTNPIASFTVVSLSCLVQVIVYDRTLPTNLLFLVSLYSLANHADYRLVRLAGLGVGFLASLIAGLRWQTAHPVAYPSVLFTFLALFILTSTTWVAGDLLRRRREFISGLEEQNAALLRERDQRTRLAAQQERTRIAREMHDIVAHSLSVVVVQADGAAYAVQHGSVTDQQRIELAARTLDTIGRTARSALEETRRLVGVLREEGTPEAQFAPTAGIADLSGLVASVRASGLTVSLDAPEQLPGVSREAGLAAYRVVQEALTNVIKHAGPQATARVHVLVEGDTLRLQVEDDGRGLAAPQRGFSSDGEGNGLIGMRERLTAAGGSFVAGPRAGGGFRVAATLPITIEEGR